MITPVAQSNNKKTIPPFGISPVNITEYAVLKVLYYFHFFKHPLRPEEILNALPFVSNLKTVTKSLEHLTKSNFVENISDYYGINLKQLHISKRNAAEERFKTIQKKLNRSARIISKFPFVQSIAISGSVSKGLVAEDGDIDFFIICKNDRLWICRTLLVLNKKLLRFNSRSFFCVNYFVGHKSLEIPDRNLFVATEIATLIPIYGHDTFKKFLIANDWYVKYLNHFKNPISIKDVPLHNNYFKRVFEKILGGKIGYRIDLYLRTRTLKRWQQKFPHFTKEHFDLAMRSERNVSKHHPSNYQTKILDYVEENMKQFLIV